ncbi:MAG TPA: PhzF family phenazine biosynthesis protein, partial [Syntrophorhabdaceae bacterium]|nr:PhzF family phenazine biosynthesis protein [Syntrophorhabdaceae bacterium]
MKTYLVDAFTEKAFGGNPAVVCFLEYPKTDVWMQSIAKEMNVSETAFLIRQGDGYNLRWFTPMVEVELCGHATLASAFVLFQTGWAKTDQSVRFYTKSGILGAAWANEWISLDFPATPAKDAILPEGLVSALGVEPEYTGKTQFDFLIEVRSEEVVRGLKPDFGALAKVPRRGVIVTSRSDSPEADFVSRFFCPRLGINEDPVTGSAHCCLGPYWAKKLNRTEFVAHQASDRGGV